MPNIAVLDVETTGINPWRHHRIVEIAAVVMRHDGTVIREFVTLVNPDRDIGPSKIHGLSSEDVATAPRFPEIAGTLIGAIEDCAAIAGHNIQFDYSFVSVEFDRMHALFPDIPRLCTLRLSGGGTLRDCCDAHSVAFDGEAHAALNDARATARLLAALLKDNPQIVEAMPPVPSVTWPRIRIPQGTLQNREIVRRRQSEVPSYVQRLLAQKPAPVEFDTHDGATVAYMALLDQVLEDRQIDDDEGDTLVEMASRWGLDGESIRDIHNNYLAHLAAVALADQVVTPTELRDLQRVARLLGITASQLDAMLAEGVKWLSEGKSSDSSIADCAVDGTLVGKSVCFTGECLSLYNGKAITRELAEQFVASADLRIAQSVTKKLDLLVVADPQTQSGKAKKARQYGVRILHEPVFWKALGIEVQ